MTKVEDEYSIRLVVDKSSAVLGLSHYVAIFLWVGWIAFYPSFFFSIPFLWYYCKPLLATIVVLIVTSALYPTDRKMQPKVSLNHEKRKKNIKKKQ
jgi:hypothetical protein